MAVVVKETRADKVFNVINFILITLFFLSVFYPLYFIIIASISDPAQVAYGKVIFYPKGISLAAYQEAFATENIWTSYRNTVLYTSIGTLWNLFLTIPAAYALSKKRLRGRGIFLFFITFTMYFSGGMIPSYLNIKNLGLLNTWWVLIVSSGVSAYNLIIAKTFFANSISPEMEEAATIDGASSYRTFFSIVLPLSKAMLGVLMLYYMIGHWNGFTSALIYLNSSPEKWPLALVLRNMLIVIQGASTQIEQIDPMELERRTQLANLMKYALIILSSVPLMILYPLLQKCFEKGIMIGSVKG